MKMHQLRVRIRTFYLHTWDRAKIPQFEGVLLSLPQPVPQYYSYKLMAHNQPNLSPSHGLPMGEPPIERLHRLLDKIPKSKVYSWDLKWKLDKFYLLLFEVFEAHVIFLLTFNGNLSKI